MEQGLFSIRMRASAEGKHISGAERIIRREEIDRIVSDLRARAFSKTRQPDRIVITIDALPPGEITRLSALPVTTSPVTDLENARAAAVLVLQQAGVTPAVARAAIALLERGPSVYGGNMRGAVIMSACSGRRLEPDQERGVRVSRFDWEQGAMDRAETALAAAGLNHFRTREALVLATKVAHAPGVIAELCWSDDPDYTAGYAASAQNGYIRFPRLKSAGATTGGRVVFVQEQGFDQQLCVEYLERTPVLITWDKE